MPASVEEMGVLSDPMGAGQAGSPMVAAGHMNQVLPKMGGLGQILLDHSRGLHL